MLSYLHALRRPRNFSLRTRVLGLLTSPLTKLLLRRDPDPPVEVDLGQRKLWMHWSHNLPAILDRHPTYETEIGRLAAYVQERAGRLVMIDVGANVGDTVATLPELPGASFLCVEGSKKYFSLLRRNFSADERVTPVNALLTDGEAGGGALVEVAGTAHVGGASGSVGPDVPMETLDSIISRHPGFAAANFLKVDTDGFDFRVLKGARRLLAAAKPVLHFELCFRLWEQVGGTSVREALAELSALGYRTGILYDNVGFLIGTDSLAEQAKIRIFHEYAARRQDFYLNVIAFHAESGWEAGFLEREQKHQFQ